MIHVSISMYVLHINYVYNYTQKTTPAYCSKTLISKKSLEHMSGVFNLLGFVFFGGQIIINYPEADFISILH